MPPTVGLLGLFAQSNCGLLLLDGGLVAQEVQTPLDAVVGGRVVNGWTILNAAAEDSPSERVELIAQVRILVTRVYLANMSSMGTDQPVSVRRRLRKRLWRLNPRQEDRRRTVCRKKKIVVREGGDAERWEVVVPGPQWGAPRPPGALQAGRGSFRDGGGDVFHEASRQIFRCKRQKQQRPFLNHAGTCRANRVPGPRSGTGSQPNPRPGQMSGCLVWQTASSLRGRAFAA